MTSSLRITVLATLSLVATSTIARSDDRAIIESRLRRGYSVALDETISIQARWTLFWPKAPQELAPEFKNASEMRYLHPIDRTPLVAVRMLRGWASAGRRIRIEESNPMIWGGPEAARWSVWTTDGVFHARSQTLTAQRANITPVVPFNPSVDDLFSDAEAQIPGVVAFRLLSWLADSRTVATMTGPDSCVLQTAGGPIEMVWVAGTDEIRSVRYRLKSVPKDFIVRYYGVFKPSVFPANYPAGSLMYMVEPGQEAAGAASVYRIDFVEVGEERNPSRYAWQSIAPTSLRADTNEVLRSTGEVSPRATAFARAQQQMEPLKHTENPPSDGGLPKAIEKGPAWSRWLLVGGITSLVLAIGIGLRRRMGA